MSLNYQILQNTLINSVKLDDLDLWSSTFVFTELANTIKYGRGFLYNLVFTSDVTAFHRIKYGEGVLHNLFFTE